MKKMFVAAPISGFETLEEYEAYRSKMVAFLEDLKKSNSEFEIFCELLRVKNEDDYMTPEKSCEEDFGAIDECEIFLLFHPVKAQTSALMELGYAYAKGKKIIIVGEEDNLPYMAKGLDAQIVEIGVEDSDILCEVINTLI